MTMVQTGSSTNPQNLRTELLYREELDIPNQNSFGMDLSSKITDDKQQSVNKETRNSTSETSSRSNSVESSLKIVDNEYTSVTHSSNLITTNSNFAQLNSCSSSTLSYTNCPTSALSNTAATYNVNQDFLIRMAMQNNSSGNGSIVSNNMFHNNKLYNENLAAVAAAVANGNSHSLYQQALNVTSNSTSNNSTISAAHHLVALNNTHSSAFQNLQNAHSSQQQQHQSTQNTNSITNGQLTNDHSMNHAASSAPITNHLLSTMTNSSLNGANQRLVTTNGLINNTATSLSSTSNLQNNSSTNSSSTNSSSNSSLNSHLVLNEQILNPNLILASQTAFVPSTLIDTSTNNLFSGIKKRKRSPQPIPQDLKDDAYWDRRRRNNESAKRSREVRRIKEQGIALRLAYLEKRNLQLTTELEMMREEAKKMHDIIYCQRYSQNSQHDKHL